TVRPEMLEPLRPGRDYRFMTVYRRKVAPGEDFTGYADLYRQASATADARIAELTCPNSHRIHTWIAAQNWFRHKAGPHDLAGASITMGVSCLDPEDTVQEGELPPVPHQLRAPGGSKPREGLQVKFDEAYSGFDFREAAQTHSEMTHPEVFMFSYG